MQRRDRMEARQLREKWRLSVGEENEKGKTPYPLSAGRAEHAGPGAGGVGALLSETSFPNVRSFGARPYVRFWLLADGNGACPRRPVLALTGR